MRRGLLLALLLAVHACTPQARSPARKDATVEAPATEAPSLPAGSLRVVAIGRFDFESRAEADPTLWPEELSGIAWIEGNQYLAIGDAHAVIHRLTVRIDPATGAIASASTGPPIPLRDAKGARLPEPAMAEDREGIVYDRETRSVWIANEHTGSNARWPSLERYRLEDGFQTALLRYDSEPMLKVYGHVRPNRGFEALTRAENGSETWTVNEEALTIDGPQATDRLSGVVRLQKFDRAMKPAAQFGYRVDPYPSPITSPLLLAGKEISGLSELALLPDGRLLALERAFAGDSTGRANLRTRLYLVSIEGATDLAGPSFAEGVVGHEFVPVSKTLLWERNWGLTNSNFEAMALGPRRAKGGRLLLLMADNNAGTSQSLFALELIGL